MLMQFKELPIGARFEFRGRRYEKVALSMACDEERMGNIFHDDTEVVSEAPSVRHSTEDGAVEPGQPDPHAF
jgi:hypothetical protein